MACMKLKTAEISASLRTLFKFAVKDPNDPVEVCASVRKISCVCSTGIFSLYVYVYMYTYCSSARVVL